MVAVCRKMNLAQRLLEPLETAVELKLGEGLLRVGIDSHDVAFVEVDKAVVEGTVVGWRRLSPILS